MKSTLALAALLLFVDAVGHAQSPPSSIPIFVSGQDRSYTRLDVREPALETVRGPGALRIVSRARFRPARADGLRYSLRVRVDGGPWQTVTYADVPRSRTAMFRDGTLGVPGRLMDHRIDLGRGYHNIEILAAAAQPEIYHRVLFEPRRAKRRSWVAVTPDDAALVELVVRENLVAYYRNRAQKPFRIEVIGPTELRIFTRLENTPAMRGRIHYRLQVREMGRVINTFQLSSRRSEITTYHADDALVPGRAAEVVIPIAAGRHRLEILPLDPDKSTLLARFMLPREDLSLTAESSP
ncbi:MAG: hypothetical protein AAF772_07970 [Acidobacteriota bacterium]